MMKRALLSAFCFVLMTLPLLASAVPVHGATTESEDIGWWVDTTVDRNKNGIGDMVEKFNDHPLFLDEDNTLPLIVDFDHTPTEADVAMLEREVGFQHQWTLKHIDAVAGRVPHAMVLE